MRLRGVQAGAADAAGAEAVHGGPTDLCAVRDGCSRRVLGWAIAEHMRTDLVEAALRMAVTLRGRLPGQVTFHADRGTQYTSAQIADAAAELGVLRSMRRTGVLGQCSRPAAETY